MKEYVAWTLAKGVKNSDDEQFISIGKDGVVKMTRRKREAFQMGRKVDAVNLRTTTKLEGLIPREHNFG